MRILQICSAREIGGGERHLIDLSKALAARGHDVFAAIRPNSLLKDELNLPPRNLLFSALRNAFDVFSAYESAQFIKHNKIEIIHAHVARDYNLAAAAAKLSETPFVLTRHALFPLKKLNKFTLRGAGGVIAVSKAVARSLESVFPPEKITTIHNGVDLARFSFAMKKPNRIFKIGTIGHLAPIKGHDVFIEAAKIVSEKSDNVQFEIVGEDKSKSGENRRRLEDSIVRSNLSDKIKLIGWRDDIRPILSDLDVFVSAARSEPFGLVLLEAMASGVPVIATRTEGAREIIENNRSGALIPPEDSEVLAKTVVELLNSSEKRKEFAEHARKRVEDYFSLGKMAAETESFYFRVLQGQ